jgi:hypothetical protein
MTSKVYWKGLELVLEASSNYITRYNAQLAANLSPEQYSCVSDVLRAIMSCLALLPKNTPVP